MKGGSENGVKVHVDVMSDVTTGVMNVMRDATRGVMIDVMSVMIGVMSVMIDVRSVTSDVMTQTAEARNAKTLKSLIYAKCHLSVS